MTWHAPLKWANYARGAAGGAALYYGGGAGPAIGQWVNSRGKGGGGGGGSGGGSKRGKRARRKGARKLSQTKTTRKRKRKEKYTHGTSGVKDYSYGMVKYKMTKDIKLHKKTTPKSIYEIGISGGLVCGNGVQAVATAFQLFDSPIFATLLTAATKQRQVGGTTTQITNLDSAAGYIGDKLIVLSGEAKTIFQNQSPTPSEIIVYDLISKVTKVTASNPNTDWETGIDNIQGAAANSQTYMGASPKASKTFNMNWHIVRVHKTVIEPGSTHEHVFKFKPNRILDMEYPTNYGQIRGITHACMTVVKGTGLVDDTLAYNSAANITVPAVKIIYLTKKRYTTQACSLFTRSYVQNTDVGVISNAAVGTGNYYAQVPGQVAPYNVNVTTEFA